MPVAPATIDTMQGLSFTFNGVEYRVTKIQRKNSRGTIEISDCTQAVGSLRKFQFEPLVTGAVITLEYWGKNPPLQDTAYAIACTALGITGVNALCIDVDEGGSFGEYVKGNATFQVTG